MLPARMAVPGLGLSPHSHTCTCHALGDMCVIVVWLVMYMESPSADARWLSWWAPSSGGRFSPGGCRRLVGGSARWAPGGPAVQGVGGGGSAERAS